ncbi:PilT/PilU family type 4a pilus ATPase [Hydrogenobacter sp. T-2]|uniref:type IV pilus twitching motility protein PilT n=1 Tax=Pampinifervens diazotrophicum TaxID=1632018 RepID=UPI002B259B8B|nr:PilT/PilU family type 4a pilus ATPase [Hydrogenobacter sp. T-2]WPM31203.1 PilT/PilU family type 4a pilus ATPase [Hydrogenobacter sp. T-2]
MLQLILKRAVELGASDIHLKTASPPVIRLKKKLQRLEDFPVIDERVMEMFLNEVLGKNRRKLAEFEELGEADTSYSLPGVARFRVNVYRQRTSVGMAFRTIPYSIPSFESLNLPAVMKKVVLENTKGLILVTGPTGSGKSTTLASLINIINSTRSDVIVTIEDPIEYLFRDEKSYIVQREVGIDTSSFARGLRAALREDPDVIMVGEIRDPETAQIALQAAETGHLVMSTLHTLDAKETINRLIGMFNLEVREQIRIQLAETLIAIFSQRLLPKADETGVVPAVEVLINTASIKEAIIDPSRLDEISLLLEKGKPAYGTQTFDQHLEELYRNGLIDYNTAIRYASRPTDLELRLKGIASGGRGFI